MASWIPKIEITAGLLAGRKMSQGSLQGLWDFPSASKTSSGNIRLANRNDFSGDEWEGSFGLTIFDDLINHAMSARESGNLGQWYLLAQIDVENPEGAQYYKQAYVVEAYDDAGCDYKTRTVTRGGDEYTCKWFVANFSFRVSRFEWYSATTPYTRTDLSSNSSRAVGSACKILEGGPLDFYYAFNGGWLWDKIYLSFGSFTDNNSNDCYGVSMFAWKSKSATYAEQHPNPVDRKTFGLIGQTMTYLDQIFGEFELPEKNDPNEDNDDDPDNPNEGDSGGDGEHDKKQDPIPIPNDPTLSGVSAGFVTMYRMTLNEMTSFAAELFDPDFWTAVGQIFADPLDFICGILILPFKPLTSGVARPKLQKVPPIYFTNYYNVVQNQFMTVDCGTIDVPLFYNSCFDYNPMTKDTIYLPYIGYRSLNPDEVQGRTLHIVYKIDCMTGDCVAFITRTAISTGMVPVTQIIAQFSGNCGVRVPFGRQSFDSAIAASIQLMTGAAGALSGVAMLAGGAGALGGGGKQLVEGMIASSVSGITAGAVNGSKAHVERAGVMGASAGYMSAQTPYLIREIPRQSLPDKGYYRRLNGYPTNEAGALGDFTGFTCIESIELSGIAATEEEKEEITRMLIAGVIL